MKNTSEEAKKKKQAEKLVNDTATRIVDFYIYFEGES